MEEENIVIVEKCLVFRTSNNNGGSKTEKCVVK